MQIQSIKQNIYINNLNKNVKTKNQPHSTLPSYELPNYSHYFTFMAKTPRFKEFRLVMRNGDVNSFQKCKAQIEKLKNPEAKAKKAIAFIAGLGTTVGYDIYAEDFDEKAPYKNMMDLIEIASATPEELVNTMLERYKLITDEAIPNYKSKDLYFDIENDSFIKYDLRDYSNGCVREIDYSKINKTFEKNPDLLTDLYLGTKDGFGILHLLTSYKRNIPVEEAFEGFYDVIKNTPKCVNRLDKELKTHENRYEFWHTDYPLRKINNYIKYSQFVQNTKTKTKEDKDAKQLAFNLSYNYVKNNPEKFIKDAKKILKWNPDVINRFLDLNVVGTYDEPITPILIISGILNPDAYNKLFKKHPDVLIERYKYRDLIRFLVREHKESLEEFLGILKANPKSAEKYLDKIDIKYITHYQDPEYIKPFILEILKIASKKKNLMNIKNMEKLVNHAIELIGVEYNPFNEPFDERGESLLFNILDIKASDKKTEESIKKLFGKIKSYQLWIECFKSIDFNQKDSLGFDFLTKALFFENEHALYFWRETKYLDHNVANYNPDYDMALESCKNEDFKKYAYRCIDMRFPDLEEAVRLQSMEAIKKLQSQLDSPFYTVTNAKYEIWDLALKTGNKEFCKNFWRQYEKYLPPDAFDDLMNM